MVSKLMILMVLALPLQLGAQQDETTPVDLEKLVTYDLADQDRAFKIFYKDFWFGTGIENYQDGSHLLFFQAELGGEYKIPGHENEPLYFVVYPQVYFADQPSVDGSETIRVPAMSVNIIPAFQTKEDKNDKRTLVKTYQYLPLTYERDTSMAINHSIRAYPFGIGIGGTHNILENLGAIWSLQTALGGMQYLKWDNDGGNFWGFSPIAPSASIALSLDIENIMTVDFTIFNGQVSLAQGTTINDQDSAEIYKTFVSADIYASIECSFKGLADGLSVGVTAGKSWRLRMPSDVWTKDNQQFGYFQIFATFCPSKLWKSLRGRE